jgi:murein DD-endopeptidase MepM/ murein hydrolase activator NlpD
LKTVKPKSELFESTPFDRRRDPKSQKTNPHTCSFLLLDSCKFDTRQSCMNETNRTDRWHSCARPSLERFARHKWLIAGTGVSALLSMAAALALVPKDTGQPPIQQPVVQELNAIGVTLQSESDASYLREEQIRRSDTLSSLISRLGVSDPKAVQFLTKDASADAIARQLRPGKTVSAETTATGELITLYFPLNTGDTVAMVKRDGSDFSVSEQQLQFDAQTALKSAEIETSLFAATDAAGIPDAIAVQLAEIFGSDIDFYRDLRQGDRFSVVYETFCHKGQPVRTGRILGAEFTNAGTTYSAYWYEAADGTSAYYTALGTSLHKTFLRSPLEFSRVTSGYSSARRHPVLDITRAHKGIDYGAPVGTPVRAVADATVEFSGRQGGYGNLVILKHQGPYSTAYGHLNGFASVTRKGAKIKQGETIGYVGQTGLSSGPHLHYEFRINGTQTNPAKVAQLTPPPLKTSEVTRFKTSIKDAQNLLSLAKQVTLASND